MKLNNTMKMYGMIVMLRYHQTNSGALNTLVALKWNGNSEIDILVTILVCWRLGPYADLDQQGDRRFRYKIRIPTRRVGKKSEPVLFLLVSTRATWDSGTKY